MNVISKVSVFGNVTNGITKDNLVLKLNDETYNDSFDLEVVCESQSILNVTLYNLAEISLIGRSVELFFNGICLFNGIVKNCELLQSSSSQFFINLECTENKICLGSIKNVDFSSNAIEIKDVSKAIINKTSDNFEYIQIITQFNKGINIGDIVSYDNNLYAIETVVYCWHHKQGFSQEIHAINSNLHYVRYLS